MRILIALATTVALVAPATAGSRDGDRAVLPKEVLGDWCYDGDLTYTRGSTCRDLKVTFTRNSYEGEANPEERFSCKFKSVRWGPTGTTYVMRMKCWTERSPPKTEWMGLLLESDDTMLRRNILTREEMKNIPILKDQP
jgi:hypothetical protein